MVPCELLEGLAACEPEDDLLARDTQFAGDLVERREDDLLSHLLEAAGVTGVALRTRVGYFRRRIRGSAEGEIGDYECHRSDG